MKIATFHFNWSDNKHFDRMTRVLIHSALELGIEVDVVSLGSFESGSRHFKTDNTYKMRAWNAYMQEQPDGTDILFMDSDTQLLRCPRHVFDQPFDMAMTIRSESPRPNTGVLFVRVSPKTKMFFSAWLATQEMMYKNLTPYMELFKQYRGLNQTALMYLRTRGHMEHLDILELPCVKYNACTEDHIKKEPSDRVAIHYHYGDLRHEMLSRRRRMPNGLGQTMAHRNIRAHVARWREAEKKASDIQIEDYVYTLRTQIRADEHTRPDFPAAKKARGRDRTRQQRRSQNERLLASRRRDAARVEGAGRTPFRLTR